MLELNSQLFNLGIEFFQKGFSCSWTAIPYITFLALINLTFLYWGYWSFETFDCNPELSDSEKPKMKFIARRAMNIEQVFKFVLKYVK